jgi:hypothetical protein
MTNKHSKIAARKRYAKTLKIKQTIASHYYVGALVQTKGRQACCIIYEERVGRGQATPDPGAPDGHWFEFPMPTGIILDVGLCCSDEKRPEKYWHDTEVYIHWINPRREGLENQSVINFGPYRAI